MFAALIALGKLFHGFEAFLRNGNSLPTPKYLWVLILSKICLLVLPSSLIITKTLTLMQTSRKNNDYWLLFYALFTCVHFGCYLSFTFVAMFLTGSFMTRIINNCVEMKGETGVDEIKQYLQEYQQLNSSLGFLLLSFMSVDCVLVMLTSFMFYMSWSVKMYEFVVIFAFSSLNGMLSLIYMCSK